MPATKGQTSSDMDQDDLAMTPSRQQNANCPGIASPSQRNFPWIGSFAYHPAQKVAPLDRIAVLRYE